MKLTIKIMAFLLLFSCNEKKDKPCEEDISKLKNHIGEIVVGDQKKSLETLLLKYDLSTRGRYDFDGTYFGEGIKYSEKNFLRDSSDILERCVPQGSN